MITVLRNCEGASHAAVPYGVHSCIILHVGSVEPSIKSCGLLSMSTHYQQPLKDTEKI